MLKAWRIVKAKHAGNAFDGEGTRLFGSRWSSPGVRVVFASESLSLATLEILVHIQSSSILVSYVTFTVEIPENFVQDLDRSLIPKGWRNYPPSFQTQTIGDNWAASASSVILRVPSAIVIHEHNFLLNPLHDDFSKLAIAGPKQLDVDPRVFGR
jgi:RES domain-containing protein